MSIIYMSKFYMSVVLREQRQRMFQKKSTGMLRSMSPFNRFISWIHGWIIPGVKQKRQQAIMEAKTRKEQFMVPFPRLG